MPAAPTSQFVLRVAAADGDLGGPEVVEALALELRGELADAGAVRVDPVRVPGAPEGTRGLEILAVCSFVITAVQAGESLAKVVSAIRNVVDRFAQRRQPVRVTVGGIDVDLAGADEEAVRVVVRSLLALPAQQATGVREALVIANARYDDPELAQLRSPGSDAEALARVLGDPAIGGFEVGLLLDADERTIRRRIAAFFADRDRDDLLLLHFSCHGIKDARGRLHLAARDTDLSVLGATGVPAGFVHDALDETQSRRVVLILDCCYSGAFARGSLVRSGNDVQIADEFGAGSGRIVLTASSATEYAFEGVNRTESNARPSVFTSALVEGLESGAADLDADGEISIDELYDYTYRQVRERTPGQAPMKWSFGVEGSLVVARSARPAELPRSIVDDLASDRVVLRLEAVRALGQLLGADKPGLRSAALTALAGVRDTDDSAQVRRAATVALGADDPTDVPPRAAPAASAPPPAAPAASAPPPAAPAATRVPEAPPAAPAAKRVPEARPPAAPAGTVPAATRVPGAPPPATAPAGSGLFVAAGLLVPVSVVLYVIGVYGVAHATFSDDWYNNWVWLVELAAAGLVLATRRARWAGLLLGVVTWAWADIGPVLHSGARSYLADAWGFLVIADLLAIAAQICLGIALVRGRPAGSAATPVRWVVAGLLAVLSLVVSFVLEPLLYEAYSLDLGEGGTLRTILALLVAAAIPFSLVIPLPGRAATFLAVGWLLGGLELAITITIRVSVYGISDENRQKVTTLFVLLFVITAAAVAAAILLPRSTRRSA